MSLISIIGLNILYDYIYCYSLLFLLIYFDVIVILFLTGIIIRVYKWMIKGYKITE